MKSRLLFLGKHRPHSLHADSHPNAVLIFEPTIFAEVEKIAYICKDKTILHMNWFLQQSLEYAAQRSYLDDLYHIYPTIPNGIRDVDEKKWNAVVEAYNTPDNAKLINSLLDMDVFPLKDSYVAFLKKDRSSLTRNPLTVNRLASEIRAMGIDKLYERCTQPKESNRQMGPMFKNWIRKGELGFPIVDFCNFTPTDDNVIICGSDTEIKAFASERLGYVHMPV